MKRTLIGLIALFIVSSFAFGDMRYEAIDLSKSAMRLTYEIEDAQVGNKVFLFPSGGMIHDATKGEFKVESVFDISAKQELEYEIIKDAKTGDPLVKITYSAPIKKGEKKTLQIAVKVNMPESNFTIDKNGRNIFTYETSHAFEFMVPRNHYVIYTNQPVWIFEKSGTLIVQQLDKKPRKIVIQTRAMK
jgi:hypothetical protein